MKTVKRGFFCNDDSIKAHYHGETISDSVLSLTSILVPIIMVIIVELSLRKYKTSDRHKFFGSTISACVADIFHYTMFFIVGFIVNLLITQIGKDLVGRYRPHFIASCQPIFDDSTNCSNPINIGRYIDSFRCSNTELNKYDFDDLRRSWPSGHASISFYSMTFTAAYLYFSKNFLKNCKLFKLSTQTLFISFAWICACSRVGDNVHYCKKLLEIIERYAILKLTYNRDGCAVWINSWNYCSNLHDRTKRFIGKI